MYFPVTESVRHTLPLLDLLTRPAKEQGSWSDDLSSKVQSTCQLQPVAEWTSLNLSAQNSYPHSHLLLPICLASLSVYSLRELFMCCAVSGTLFSHPFLLLPFSLFLLIVLTYPALQFLDRDLDVLSQETGFLFKRATQTAHTVDCLPGAGGWIFLPQLLLWASQCMLCYRILHRSFRVQIHMVI